MPPDLPLKNAFLSTNIASASSSKGIGYLTVVDTTKTGAASLICSTYFGGSGGDDKVQALAFDPVPGNTSSYRLVMGGQTTSTNFPMMNPLQATLTGVQNGWISIMNVPTSSAGPNASLAYSTSCSLSRFRAPRSLPPPSPSAVNLLAQPAPLRPRR